MLFAVMGWTLAALGAPTVTRATLWWALMATAMLAVSSTPRIFMRYTGNPLPYWAAVPIFAAVTLALVIARRRQHSARVPAPTL